MRIVRSGFFHEKTPFCRPQRVVNDSKRDIISSSEVIKRKNLLNSRVYREIGGFSFEYFSVHSTAFTV